MDQILAIIPQLLQYLAALFTGAEWKALVVLIAVTLAATQWFKILWRLLPWTAFGGSGFIFLAAFVAGLLLAYPIWRAMAHDDIPWFVPGIMAGPLAVVAFKLGMWALKKYAPELARGINGDRRRPGDRRHTAGVAPGGLPERREAERRVS